MFYYAMYYIHITVYAIKVIKKTMSFIRPCHRTHMDVAEPDAWPF